jgi:hypothetical protein
MTTFKTAGCAETGSAVQRCREALAAFETGEGRLNSHLVFYRSPPCVCGREVIEATHGLAAAASKSCLLGLSDLEACSRVAQLAAEIRQLKEALGHLQQIGVATGLLAQRFAITPKRAMTLTDDADDENRRVLLTQN